MGSSLEILMGCATYQDPEDGWNIDPGDMNGGGDVGGTGGDDGTGGDGEENFVDPDEGWNVNPDDMPGVNQQCDPAVDDTCRPQ